MSDIPTIFEVRTENAAWDLLKKIIRNEIDCENLTIDFDSADWAKFSLKLNGDDFRQSLTSSSMRGLIDYQSSVYRSIGIILHGDDNINKFKGSEKDAFELVFSIKSGSSDVSAEGKDTLSELAKHTIVEACKKMTGKQILILLLVVALGYFGQASYSRYLDAAIDGKKIEAQSDKDKSLIDLAKQISQDDKEKMQLLSSALKIVPQARDVIEHRDRAIDSIVKNASRADSIDLQGMHIDGRAISSINRSTRRKAETTTIAGEFFVLAVDTSDPDVFKVTLQNKLDDEQVVSADIDDAIVMGSAHKAIQDAEWSRKPLRITMSAKLIGGEIKGAKIIRASKIRNKKDG